MHLVTLELVNPVSQSLLTFVLYEATYGSFMTDLVSYPDGWTSAAHTTAWSLSTPLPQRYLNTMVYISVCSLFGNGVELGAWRMYSNRLLLKRATRLLWLTGLLLLRWLNDLQKIISATGSSLWKRRSSLNVQKSLDTCAMRMHTLLCHR